MCVLFAARQSALLASAEWCCVTHRFQIASPYASGVVQCCHFSFFRGLPSKSTTNKTETDAVSGGNLEGILLLTERLPTRSPSSALSHPLLGEGVSSKIDYRQMLVSLF